MHERFGTQANDSQRQTSVTDPFDQNYPANAVPESLGRVTGTIRAVPYSTVTAA